MKHFLLMSLFIYPLLHPATGNTKDYIIYNVSQELPMGVKNEIIKKNYYINFGSKQGVKEGVTLNVYRNLSRIDPYDGNKRYTYQVKIGEMKVLHVQEYAAIGRLANLNRGEDTPLFELDYFMLGDKIEIKVQ